MPKHFCIRALICLLSFGISSPSFANSYQDGIAAYQAKDFPKARKYFEVSAKKNNLSAIFNLGVMLSKGIGGDAKPSRALRLFEQASEAGMAAAQHNLALAYFSGKGTEQDLARAQIWWQRAARQDHTLAQFNLGVLLWNDTNSTKNRDTAIKWFKRAAQAGHGSAQEYLNKVLSEQAAMLAPNEIDNSDPLLKNASIASLLSAASEAYAQKEFTLAHQNWKLAAEAGSGSALYQLAQMSLSGIGATQNKALAFDYFEQSAKTGQGNAQYQLAQFYLLGEVVEKNTSLALFWMQSAADNKHLKAKDWLEQQR